LVKKGDHMEESEPGRSQREQFQEFVDDWAKFANGFINSSAAFAKRMVRQQAGEEGAGDIGLQDLWMTMASAAGDLAELSYKWVQAVDGLAGFTSDRHSKADSDSERARKQKGPASGSTRGSGGPDRETRPQSGTWTDEAPGSSNADGD
jgi:hypothetical protein